MGILTRMFRLCKADVHGIMDQMEDKSLLLKQYLREMEAGLKAKEASLDRIAKSCRQIERDLRQREEEVQKLEKDLDLAVRKEKDDIARMLIRKRRTLQGTCEQLAGRIETLTEEKGYLSETLDRQRLQYDQLKVKVASFSQLAEQQEVDDASGAMDAFPGWQPPTQEEIELELLQRKEAMQQGGAR